ncbi:protein TIC 20-v chloroplastic [Tripterygium wilfordii]|uniref:Protein TIC 20-v chloroplastic n=1 Tax=Tripterygium wilfordii TaxID=458696 RepID=A0A7J7C178_TRIWF|nr:protein TIC 20-v chloroplastic [Tripterygium wilfordii]
MTTSISNLLSPRPPLTFSHKQLSLKHSSLLSFTSFTKETINKAKPRRRLSSINAKNNGSDDAADAPDRIISAVCYFYPFFDGIQYGKCPGYQLLLRQLKGLV